MKKKNFAEYCHAIRKTILSLVIVLVVILSILSNSDNNIGDANFIIITSLTFLFLGFWMVYWLFAQYNRLLKSFQSNDVSSFLETNGFKVNEHIDGWDHEYSIFGNYNDCMINILLDFKKGNLWHKYYFRIGGISKENFEKLRQETDVNQGFSLQFYPEKILLTRNPNCVVELKKVLSEFTNELLNKEE